MLPMYVSHIQILHPRQKLSLIAAVLLDRYLFQQKTKTKREVCCSFQWKPSGKKKVKNSTWGCKTALKSNTLFKPLNSVKSCNSYTLSFKKMCISSDSDLVWIKHVCKSQHQGLLIMKAASPLALDLHCSTTGDMLMVALQWLVCSQVILPCAAGLSKDQTGQTQERLENIWWPTAGTIPFHNYLSFVLVFLLRK